MLFIISLGFFNGKVIADARTNPTTPIERAKSEFAKGNYGKAADFYRKHLRKNRRDYSAWNQLAVAVYHTGLPQKALNILKRYVSKTRVKSYSFYYQGLCYLALGENQLAQYYLSESARYTDEYASRATFELAAKEYNDGDNEKTRYWLSLYRQRYPKGVFIKLVQRMEASLTSGQKISGIVGNQKPDVDKALYKYNGRSLMLQPHFWFTQLGFEAISGIQADPAPEEKTGIKNQEYANQDLILAAGFGIGPIESKGATSWVGYNYRQRWITNVDRLQTYADDPMDFAYFPFQPDLLERRHQIYGDVRTTLGKHFFFGAFAEQEFIKIGSDYFSGPDDDLETQQSQNVARVSTIIPWIGANYADHFQTLFYFYLRKEISEEAPEFSNKTYSLIGSDQPVMSYGLSHRMNFPKANLDATVELFHFEWIYNDNWLDFKRTGGITGVEYEFIKDFRLTSMIGYYQDAYILRSLKQNSCTFTKNESRNLASKAPKECPRTDTGNIYELGLYWNFSQFERIAAKYTIVENKNADQAVYNKSENTITISATMAFPSVGRVQRLVERFGEVAFTKQQE